MVYSFVIRALEKYGPVLAHGQAGKSIEICGTSHYRFQQGAKNDRILSEYFEDKMSVCFFGNLRWGPARVLRMAVWKVQYGQGAGLAVSLLYSLT
jgi:hypothetical protein